MNSRPNVVILLADDLGFSDLGCYGSEIRTPHLDRLAMGGTRLANFHNTPRCSPSRASLLTGLHPHQTGIGILVDDNSKDGGYRGTLNNKCVTLAELLRAGGYATAIRGKWHLSSDNKTPDGAWPTERGFDSFYGTLTGCGSYYEPGTLTRGTTNIEEEAKDPDFFYTDRIADEAVAFIDQHVTENVQDQPFFLYVPFTAPHWPLHARPETIESYDGVYSEGWDAIRQSRFERQKELGVIAPHTQLSPRDPSISAWEDEAFQEWQVARMQVYASMVTEMDTAIGRILVEIESKGLLENTIILFMSDNGAASEDLPLFEREVFLQRTDILRYKTRAGKDVHIGNDPLIKPGPENTYASYGKGWANVSNTPFRFYKVWTHEGGVSSPFIAHWPAGSLKSGSVLENPFQLVNIVPTILEATKCVYPQNRNDVDLFQLEGGSMLRALRGGGESNPQLWWEHVGNAAIQRDNWKLVRQYDWPWELYDISKDRSELNDVSADFPEIVKELSDEWDRLAEANGVIPFRKTLEIYRKRGLGRRYAIG